MRKRSAKFSNNLERWLKIMNKNDMKLLEKYANEIFGCNWDDLSDDEQRMLIAHVREREYEFENHYGI